MNRGRFVWVVGVLSGLLGCSGRYEVGKLPNAGESGAGAESTAGGAFINAPIFVGYAGSPELAAGGATSGGAAPISPGAGNTGSAGPSNSVGGYEENGYQPYGPSPSYCGIAIPLTHLTGLATPDVVWRRIQLFLLDRVSEPAPELPALTTRSWAAEQAMAALDSVANDPGINSPYLAAPGLERFVGSWLPGTTRGPLWASFFSDSKSFWDLLTSDLGQAHGVGVLTDPVILQQPNLVHRGAYISNNIICQGVPPPPPTVPPIDSQPEGGTRRMQFEAHTSNVSCRGCHGMIDPFGIPLEHFTPGTGEYSDVDNGFPIDSSASIRLQYTGSIPVHDATDLGQALASSCEAAQCLIQRLLADAENRAGLPVPGSTDPAAVAEIGFASYRSGHNLRGLIWYLVQSDTFLRP